MILASRLRVSGGLAALSVLLAGCGLDGRVSTTARSSPPGASAESLIAEGRSHYEAYDFERARASLDQALALNPASKEALFYRGMSLLRLDRPDPAMNDFVRAVELDPDYAPPHAGRAEVLVRRRALDEADAALDRALALEPRLAEGWYARGLVLGSRGEVQRAVEAFQEALRIDPRLAYAHYQLGLAHNQSGRVDLAIDHLEKFLELAPRAPEAPQVRELLNTLRKSPARPGAAGPTSASAVGS